MTDKQKMLVWDKTHMGEIPLEEVRSVLSALLDHLHLNIETFRWYDGGAEYRFSKIPAKERNKPSEHSLRPLGERIK